MEYVESDFTDALIDALCDNDVTGWDSSDDESEED